MARKSNKTSHVLHLLAGEEPVPGPDEKKEEPVEAVSPETDKENPPEETETGQDMPNISIISTGNSENDPVADLIKGQLEEDFPEDILTPQPAANDAENGSAHARSDDIRDSDSDLSDPAGVSDDDPISDTTGTSAARDISASADYAIPDMAGLSADSDVLTDSDNKTDTAVIPDAGDPPDPTDTSAPDQPAVPAQTDTDDTETTFEKTASVQADVIDTNDDRSEETPVAGAQDKPTVAQEDLDSVLHPVDGKYLQNYRFVNVMEYIVKDLVIDYMKKFDMCTCERCVVDTMALALTYCHAKYIVVDSHTVSPLLNYYSNKYLGDVTVELTKACIKIKDNPRH